MGELGEVSLEPQIHEGNNHIRVPEVEAAPLEIVKPQRLDTEQYFGTIRLQDSFYDYGLDDYEKGEVLYQLKSHSDVLTQALGTDAYRSVTIGFMNNVLSENDNIPELKEFGYSFIDQHIPQLKEHIYSAQDYEHKRELVNFLLRLNESTNPDYQDHLAAAFDHVFHQEMNNPPVLEGEARQHQQVYQEYLKRIDVFLKNQRAQNEDRFQKAA